MKKSILLSLVFVLCSCSGLKYQSDFGSFMNSAQANSPEYLVFINSIVCKDVEGLVGFCAKRIKSDENIVLKFDKRPYSYRLDIQCTDSVGANLSIDVLPEKDFFHEIKASQFSHLLAFTCIGEISPNDRAVQVSAFFQARILIYDKNYKGREKIYLTGKSLILGEHAKYSLVNDDQYFKKETVVKVKNYRRSYSESESMRFNYDGY